MTDAAAPVLYLFFNRPDCVAESFRAIRAARPPRLYLAADAPRPSVASDGEACAAARATVEALIDWPCIVLRNYSPINLGPTRRITSAITWFFEHEEQGIIFEEDCVPDASFFPFCHELLGRYAHAPQVGMITGDQFVPGGWPGADDASYAFARLTQIWGWATWRRAWQNYDPALTAWPGARRTKALHRILPSAPNRRYWTKRFDACHRGELDVWDYGWACARWLHDQVGIVPRQNLVRYVGFRPDALHTTGSHPCANVPTTAIAFPLRHPAAIAADRGLDARTSRLLFYEGNWWTYQRDKLRRLLNGR
jgi:hypothetical protein